MTKLFSSDFSMDNNQWTNITQDFFEAIQDLELGELLHDDFFGLYEAMSVIEMMDPKMDAGMLCNRGTRAPLTFDIAVETGELKLDDIPMEDLITIIDKTWACFLSWLDGHSLAQTIFTNLYFQNPHLIKTRPLKVFCIAIYKIIDLVNSFISKGYVSEEEDFRASKYGYKLEPDISEVRSVGMLTEVEGELCRLKKKSDDALVNALLARISFTKLFLRGLISLSKKDITAGGVSESNKSFLAAANWIPGLSKTVDLGSPPAYVSEVHGPVTKGFDPTVNHRLLPSTFPRYPPICSHEETYKKLDELLARVRDVSRITTITSFQPAIDLMLEISCAKQCIFSRSVAQCLYLPQFSRPCEIIDCVEALKEDARSFVSPPALMPKALIANCNEMNDHVERFFKHSVRPFSNMIQLCGYNRARQRDKLAHLLVDFASLLSESERADVCLHNIFQKSSIPRPHLACFGTWVLYHTVRVMIMFLLTGFELDLYSAHEYHYIYWYLCDFLYGWLFSTISTAEGFINEQDNITCQIKNKKKTKLKPPKRRSFRREMTMCRGLQNLCGGYYKAMIGFLKDGQVKLPNPEFDSERVRYEHRFGPFNALSTPRPVQYVEFREITLTLQSNESEKLYWSASEHFQLARSFFDSVQNPEKEVADLILIAKRNFIVTKLLATTPPDKRTTKPPHFDFSLHHHFPVIKLFS